MFYESCIQTWRRVFRSFFGWIQVLENLLGNLISVNFSTEDRNPYLQLSLLVRVYARLYVVIAFYKALAQRRAILVVHSLQPQQWLSGF